MYAEEIILIASKTYAPDEKTVLQSRILHNSSINDKSTRLSYIQRFPERKSSHDSPPLLNPTPIPLTPFSLLPNLRRKNLSALKNFSGDSDDEADTSLQQISSTRFKQNDEKSNGKTAEVFRKLMESN